MTWTSAPGTPAAEILLEQSKGYATIEWAGMVVVGVYASPNSGLVAFEVFLDGIGDCVRRYLSSQVLVLGDFNAHSSQWGHTMTDARGRVLLDWAADLGLLLLNRGSTSTCVAWNGCFVVDITWGTPNAFRQVSGWRVAEGVETLSDHLYIFVEAGPETNPAREARGIRGIERSRPPSRWRLKDRNNEMLQAAAIVAAWNWDARAEETSVDKEAENLRRDMKVACGASMPHSVPGARQNGNVYWWTPEIAELRARCIRARGRFHRARRRRLHNEEEISLCYETYRELRHSLQWRIKSAKARAWMDLVQLVESDPWGRPYRMVMKKLRPRAPPLTADMDPALLEEVIRTLFPPQGSVLGPILWIIEYDAVLRCPILPDSGIVCYANDTLVLAGGSWWHETLRHRELAAACNDTGYTRAGPEGVPSQVGAHMVL
ncbi:uncharacterized protein LOC122574999 [Bombus pyrosoma]|uniref:uncharacterized protein LOC122574999 n=1 Tax=Bombus pyrosoma TaxID=396416 RepID=UPI001CB9C56E|nr:uncharacterized protein LOC122574999 [Bombus pyrosoma]